MTRNSYVLDIQLTAAAMTTTGMFVFVRNERTREIVKTQMDSNGYAIYDLQNLSSGYSNGDRIVCYVAGEEFGVFDAHTVDTSLGGATLTHTSVAETSTTAASISIG